MPICEGCGSSFADSFQFCPHCGRATPKPQSMEVNIKEAIPSNACPICQRNDRIEKVSVIYMHGSHDTTMSVPVTEINSDSEGRTYSTTRRQQVTGIDETKLAQALRPPTKPEAQRPPSWGWYFIGGGALAIYFCAPFSAMVGGSLLGETLWSPRSVAFGILVFIIIMGFIISRYSSSKERYKINMANYNSSILPAWERSLEKWNTLYFCHRDGCVFKLGEQVKVGIPLEKMAEFIGWRN